MAAGLIYTIISGFFCGQVRVNRRGGMVIFEYALGGF